MCIHQEANGCDYFCPVRALGRRVCYIRRHTSDQDTLLSAYWHEGARCDVTDGDIRESIKAAAATLRYPETRGIEIDDVDTHSLRGGGANALHMAGYTDLQIMKMGCWKTKTFLEYIREELGCSSSGMSRAMKRVFKYVNVSGDRWNDVMSAAVVSDYESEAEWEGRFDGQVVAAQRFRASPHEYDAAHAAEARHVRCGTKAEEVGCCGFVWLGGGRRRTQTSLCERAPRKLVWYSVLLEPALGWGRVKLSFPSRWPTPRPVGDLFGLEGAGFESIRTC